MRANVLSTNAQCFSAVTHTCVQQHLHIVPHQWPCDLFYSQSALCRPAASDWSISARHAAAWPSACHSTAQSPKCLDGSAIQIVYLRSMAGSNAQYN
jgi:hypothetical protein